MRLLGENNNPLVLPGETIMSTWNGKRQGVQSVIMWRPYQDAVDMLNFCAMFGFSMRLRRGWNDARVLKDWVSADPYNPKSELGFNRIYWELLRFLDVNRARKFSAFDSREIISLAQPGSQVTAFAREGRLMVDLGFLLPQEPSARAWSTRPQRSEILAIHQPESLGLESGVRYRIVDLLANRYLDGHRYSPEQLKEIPVTLTLGSARILLIAPAQEKSHLVYFRGADRVGVEAAEDNLTFRIDAVEGSPVALHLDTRGVEFKSLTPGISAEDLPGDFEVFSGFLPADRKVVLKKGE
jgi:hypothetical protein